MQTVPGWIVLDAEAQIHDLLCGSGNLQALVLHCGLGCWLRLASSVAHALVPHGLKSSVVLHLGGFLCLWGAKSCNESGRIGYFNGFGTNRLESIKC